MCDIKKLEQFETAFLVCYGGGFYYYFVDLKNKFYYWNIWNPSYFFLLNYKKNMLKLAII